jgi:hypothetical protein
MEKRKVIAYKNLPAKLNASFFISVYLLLEHLNASEWIYGAFGLVATLKALHFIGEQIRQKETDIFEN